MNVMLICKSMPDFARNNVQRTTCWVTRKELNSTCLHDSHSTFQPWQPVRSLCTEDLADDMAWIPRGLCWSRHLTDPLQPYKGCQGSGGKQMHLSVEGRKQEEGVTTQRWPSLKGGLCLFTCRGQWGSYWPTQYRDLTDWLWLWSSHFPCRKNVFKRIS